MRTLPDRFLAAAPAVAGTFALTALLSVVPGGDGPLHAQERGLADIASTEVAVSRDEATLRIELASGDDLEIRLQDGRVHVDGEELGAFGSELGTAWRELLGRAVALDDGPLARALVDWEPPVELDGSDRELGARIDRALEDALRRDAVTAADPPATPHTMVSALTRLLGQTDRLAGLAVALDDLDIDELTLRVDEDVVVAEDEVIDASLLVIGGDVDLRGEVSGHVIVVGGTLHAFEGSSVGGDVRVTEGRLVRDGGTVGGVVRALDPSALAADIEARAREAEASVHEARETAREVRDRRARVASDDHDGGFFSPLRAVGRSVGGGIAGIVQTFMFLVVLSIFGGLAVMFGGGNLEVVAETARRSPGRAAVVGLAGAFLTIPVWIVGLVALCISIIGIPVALAWLPLFPLAVVAAAAMGYFAVAHNTGRWVARRRYPYMDWVRVSNPYTLVAGGVTALLAAFFLANVVRIFGPWLGFLQGMLIAAGVVITVGAALVGFGAVLLTRAGRRPEYYAGGSDPFADPWDWEPPPSRPGPSRPTGDPFAPNEPADFAAGGPAGGSGAGESPAGPSDDASGGPAEGTEDATPGERNDGDA